MSRPPINRRVQPGVESVVDSSSEEHHNRSGDDAEVRYIDIRPRPQSNVHETRAEATRSRRRTSNEDPSVLPVPPVALDFLRETPVDRSRSIHIDYAQPEAEHRGWEGAYARRRRERPEIVFENVSHHDEHYNQRRRDHYADPNIYYGQPGDREQRSSRRRPSPGKYGRYSTFENAKDPATAASPLIYESSGRDRKTGHKAKRARKESIGVTESGPDASDEGIVDSVGGDSTGRGKRNIILDSGKLIEDPTHFVLCVYRNNRRNFDSCKIKFLTRNKEPSPAPYTLKTDREIFCEMRYHYRLHLVGWVRLLFSFKTLRGARLLQYGAGRFSTFGVRDPVFSESFVFILKTGRGLHPLRVTQWAQWIAEKRMQLDMGRRMLAIELLEAYDAVRIVTMVGVILLIILTLSIVWILEGEDPGYMAGVMSYVLTFMAAVVALTGIWDWFDGGQSERAKEDAVWTPPDDYNERAPYLYPDTKGG